MTDTRQLRLTELGLLKDVETSTHISVRLDQIEGFNIEDYIKYIDTMKDLFHLVIITQELGVETQKLHYHVYLKYIKQTKLDSIQVAFRRKFPQRKSQYAISIVKNISSFIAYISKDKKPLYLYNISKEVINEIADLWIDDTKFKKEGQASAKFLDILYKGFTEKYSNKQKYDLMDIKKYVIKYYIDNKKIFNEFQVEGYIKSLYGMLDYNSFEMEVLERMNKRF